jgi:hypothetical protein
MKFTCWVIMIEHSFLCIEVLGVYEKRAFTIFTQWPVCVTLVSLFVIYIRLVCVFFTHFLFTHISTFVVRCALTYPYIQNLNKFSIYRQIEKSCCYSCCCCIVDKKLITSFYICHFVKLERMCHCLWITLLFYP